jgi:hypothetical protein
MNQQVDKIFIKKKTKKKTSKGSTVKQYGTKDNQLIDSFLIQAIRFGKIALPKVNYSIFFFFLQLMKHWTLETTIASSMLLLVLLLPSRVQTSGFG